MTTSNTQLLTRRCQIMLLKLPEFHRKTLTNSTSSSILSDGFEIDEKNLLGELYKKRRSIIVGVKIVEEPQFLRHFTSKFTEITH